MGKVAPIAFSAIVFGAVAAAAHGPGRDLRRAGRRVGVSLYSSTPRSKPASASCTASATGRGATSTAASSTASPKPALVVFADGTGSLLVPDLTPNDDAACAGYLGADYPLNHPAGFNGGSYFLRLSNKP